MSVMVTSDAPFVSYISVAGDVVVSCRPDVVVGLCSGGVGAGVDSDACGSGGFGEGLDFGGVGEGGAGAGFGFGGVGGGALSVSAGGIGAGLAFVVCSNVDGAGLDFGGGGGVDVALGATVELVLADEAPGKVSSVFTYHG